MRKTVEPVGYMEIRRRAEGGYLLLDAALAILIIGIITVGFLQFQKHFAERESFIETDNKIEIIADALSTYAQTRWRLPCPADPIKPNNVPFGSERATCATAANSHGLVPYRTLGLPEQYAKDNYGHFFTYVVSPAFTRQNTVLGAAGDITHARLAHYIDNDRAGFLPKAQFCGGLRIVGGNNTDSTTDLIAQSQGANLMGVARDDTAANFIDQPYNLPGPPDPNYYRGINVTAFAVALISHGPNGYGAYLENNTAGQNTAIPGFGNSEDQTRTIDRLVALEREIRRASGANYYDDIITVFTQDQILAAAGGGSCEHP